MKKKKRLKRSLQYLIAVLIGLVISYCIMINFRPVFVSGNSMNPTFKNGEILASTTSFTYNSIHIGDIVVFKYKIQMIKRVVAKEGDVISIENGILYVNGKASKYQFQKINDPGMLSSQLTIPKGYLFCMGDNRNNSMDCRIFGPVKFSQLKYKIVKKIF